MTDPSATPSLISSKRLSRWFGGRAFERAVLLKAINAIAVANDLDEAIRIAVDARREACALR